MAKPKSPSKPADPLHQLFEHFLLTRSYENAQQFTKVLAESYLAYLDSTLAHMPFEARQTVLEDLATEAHELLVKRMYGNVSPIETSTNGKVHHYSNGKVVNPQPLHMPDVLKPGSQDPQAGKPEGLKPTKA